MSLTIISTAGAIDANSFCDRATAQLYFDGRLYSDAWTDAADTDKDKALVSATNRLNQERYKGMPTHTTQALVWPRWGVPNPEFEAGNVGGHGLGYGLGWGRWIDSTTIPDFMVAATCEFALVLLAEDRLSDTGLELIEQVGVGDLNVTPSKTRRAGRLPEHCRRFIDLFLLSTGGMVPLIRS